MNSNMSKEIQKETIMQDIQKETEEIFLFTNEGIHDYDETSCRFVQQNIKKEFYDEMVSTLNEEMDPLGTNNIEHRTDASEYNTPVEQIYIKEEFDHVEEIKKENENNDSFNNKYTCNEQEDTEEDIDANQHFIEYPEVNMDVTKMSMLQDNTLCKGKKRSREASTTGKYVCEECNKHYTTSGNLQRHNKVIHNRIIQYKCQECTKTFTTYEELKNHIRILHEEKSASDNNDDDDDLNRRNSKTVKTVPRDKGTFMCVECEKDFPYLISLQRHYKNIHQRVVCYNCHVCNQRFSHMKELNIHIKTMHKEKVHKCYDCNKCFTQSAGLERHISAIHKRIKSFKCKHCTESFTQSSSLNRHIRAVHEGIKNHECQQCHKKFSDSSGLKTHIAVMHEGAKNFECEYCHKKFCYFSKLKTHMSVTHKGYKDFQCKDCEKWYSDLGVLKRHIRLVHEHFKKFGCDECGSMFGQMSTLKRHIKNIHVYKQNMQV